MTSFEALQVAAKLYPRGVLRCEEDVERDDRCHITHNGRLVAAGRDWSEALRAARERRGRHLEQPTLF